MKPIKNIILNKKQEKLNKLKFSNLDTKVINYIFLFNCGGSKIVIKIFCVHVYCI